MEAVIMDLSNLDLVLNSNKLNKNGFSVHCVTCSEDVMNLNVYINELKYH